MSLRRHNQLDQFRKRIIMPQERLEGNPDSSHIDPAHQPTRTLIQIKQTGQVSSNGRLARRIGHATRSASSTSQRFLAGVHRALSRQTRSLGQHASQDRRRVPQRLIENKTGKQANRFNKPLQEQMSKQTKTQKVLHHQQTSPLRCARQDLFHLSMFTGAR